MCRAGAVADRPGHRPRRDPRPAPQALAAAGLPAAGPPRHASPSRRPARADYAAYLRGLVDLTGIRPLKVVVDAGNGMGGHTVPTVFGRPAAATSSRCTSSSTAPSPTTRPTRSTRRTSSTCRPGRREPAPTSAWPSTATPTAASSSTSAASRSRRPRSPRWSPRANWPRHPGAHDHPQPDHLAGGARDRRASTAARRCAPGSVTPSSRPRWPAPARSSAASTPRTTTSATSGAPTPACSPRMHVLAALGEQDGTAVRPAPPSTTATPPPARSTRRSTDQAGARRRGPRRVRRPRRRRPSTTSTA